ncbi:MAG: non-heme iron oxygenase ferredoxin subunit [Sinobacteraceae bacterium]|nr:non-heme iron oxygenase ferredoxin subunit [Nevskiaceae bacterium]
MSTAKEWIEICATAEVPDGEIRQKQLPGGHEVAIYQIDGEYFVTDDTCTHEDASLSEDGDLDGYEVECSWHFGRFDVRTGAACAMPCEHALRTWPVKVEDGKVLIEVSTEQA